MLVNLPKIRVNLFKMLVTLSKTFFFFFSSLKPCDTLESNARWFGRRTSHVPLPPLYVHAMWHYDNLHYKLYIYIFSFTTEAHHHLLHHQPITPSYLHTYDTTFTATTAPSSITIISSNSTSSPAKLLSHIYLCKVC